MSLFSYIAFPREIDASLLKTDIESGIKALNYYKMGELMWNEENGSVVCNPFSRGGEIIDCSKLSRFFIHGIRVFEDISNATLENCFKNKNIYGFQGSVSFRGDLNLFKEHSEFTIDMMKSSLLNIELCRKQLRDLLLNNLEKGEVAEIYSEMVSGTNFNLGPPLKKLFLTVDEILFSQDIDLSDRLKIEIRKC